VALFRRGRTRLPDAAREALGLPADVRVLAWSSLVGDGWAAALPAGLRAVLPGALRVERPWTDVDRVAWDRDSRMLVVWWVGSRRATPLEVQDQGSFLPEVIHERVRSSMVLVREVPLPDGRTVRVALRRTDDGTLSTQVVPGRGVRMSDPEVAALVDRARAALLDEAGAAADV
jgi:hypothetical protein